MNVELEIKVDTKAEARIVLVNFKKVTLDSSGTGTASVELNADNVLQWGLVGDSGTPYTITLNPQQGKLKIGGQHPIVLQIPIGVQQAAGNRRFRVIPKEEKP